MAVVKEAMSLVLCIGRADASVLAGFRLVSGLEVSEEGPTVWLRAQHSDEALSAKLAGLPASERYEWLPPHQLRVIGQRIPSKTLPQLKWIPLSEWLQIETPTAALPGRLTFERETWKTELASGVAQLRLVRSHIETEPDLLLTSLEEFHQFVKNAAQVRLDRLRFAANADGQVLVHGRPLPPLPGKRFVLHAGIAVPAGFTWEPAVSAEVLARSFGVAGDAIVLWNMEGTIIRLHTEQFVPVSRSALRATEAAFSR